MCMLNRSLTITYKAHSALHRYDDDISRVSMLKGIFSAGAARTAN